MNIPTIIDYVNIVDSKCRFTID